MKRFFSITGMVFLMTAIPLQAATRSDPCEAVSTKPDEDPDQDGLTNQEEAEAGTYPYNAYSDADIVMDGQDGWALDGGFSPPRLPKVGYAVVDLTALGLPQNAMPKNLSNRGDVLYMIRTESRGEAWYWPFKGISKRLPYSEETYSVPPILFRIVTKYFGSSMSKDGTKIGGYVVTSFTGGGSDMEFACLTKVRSVPAYCDPDGNIQQLAPAPFSSSNFSAIEVSLESYDNVQVNDSGATASWAGMEIREIFTEYQYLGDWYFDSTYLSSSGSFAGTPQWQPTGFDGDPVPGPYLYPSAINNNGVACGFRLEGEPGGRWWRTYHPMLIESSGSVVDLPGGGEARTINSLNPPVVVGDGGGLWFNDGTWRNISTGRMKGNSDWSMWLCEPRINDRCEIVGTDYSSWYLVRNGVASDLDDLILGWSVKAAPSSAQGLDINDSGVILTVAVKSGESTSKPVLLLPVQMKLLWETKNKANQIYNPTKKDDPWYYEGFGSTGGSNNGASRNRLFLVPDPEDNKYKATLEVEMPEEFRTKFIAAAYVVDTKVANSDKAFDAEGKCELEFEHLGTSEDIQDFAIRIGYDANNSGTLDPGEITKLAVKNYGEPLVRGTKVSRYNEAKDKIDNIVDTDWTHIQWPPPILSNLLLPHAKSFLQIFRQGNTSGIASDKQPTSSTTVSFDAFSGYFSEWLTHNSGAPFDDEGVADIKDYTWNLSTSAANLVATSRQIEEPLRNYYNSSVASLAAAHFSSLPVGSPPAYFPSATGFYDIPHAHESPAWVPVATVTFDSWLPNQGDDVNGTIGRGRLLSHKARYRVEKLSVNEGPPDAPYYVERLVVTQVISQGEVIDLYDFNHMVGGAAQDAAILQIGFGKGAYGADRNRGKIYRNRIEFDKPHTSLP